MADTEVPPEVTSEPTVEKVQAEQPAESSEPTEAQQKEGKLNIASFKHFYNKNQIRTISLL